MNRQRCQQTTKQETNTSATNDHVSDSVQSTEDINKAVNLPRALVTPPPSPPPTRATGFAAFAGAGSPFMVSPFAPNGTMASPTPQRPVWCGNTFAKQPSPVLSDSQVVDSAAAASSSINEVPPVENLAGPRASEAALAAVETRVKTTVARKFCTIEQHPSFL